MSWCTAFEFEFEERGLGWRRGWLPRRVAGWAPTHCVLEFHLARLNFMQAIALACPPTHPLTHLPLLQGGARPGLGNWHHCSGPSVALLILIHPLKLAVPLTRDLPAHQPCCLLALAAGWGEDEPFEPLEPLEPLEEDTSAGAAGAAGTAAAGTVGAAAAAGGWEGEEGEGWGEWREEAPEAQSEAQRAHHDAAHGLPPQQQAQQQQEGEEEEAPGAAAAAVKPMEGWGGEQDGEGWGEEEPFTEWTIKEVAPEDSQHAQQAQQHAQQVQQEPGVEERPAEPEGWGGGEGEEGEGWPAMEDFPAPAQHAQQEAAAGGGLSPRAAAAKQHWAALHGMPVGAAGESAGEGSAAGSPRAQQVQQQEEEEGVASSPLPGGVSPGRRLAGYHTLHLHASCIQTPSQAAPPLGGRQGSNGCASFHFATYGKCQVFCLAAGLLRKPRLNQMYSRTHPTAAP